jgi:hypothetical protein
MRLLINTLTASVAGVLLAIASPAQSRSKSPDLASEPLRKPWIILTLQTVKPTSYGFDVQVRVKNDGTAPVVLALYGDGRMAANPTLQSLTVEQWDKNLGWQDAGPCREAIPEYTVTLHPGWIIQNTVPIFDPARVELDPMCLTHITHLDGKIRAALYFAYENEKQFRDSMKPPFSPAHLESASKTVQLPRRRAKRSEKSLSTP